jgi:hypothetical protein
MRIRFNGRPVRGFALSAADDDIDAIVAAKLAEGGYATVSDYQRANGLSVDGVAGHDTLTAMGYGYLFDLAGQGKLKEGQTQLGTKRTPLTPEQAAEALSAGYQAITGNAPTPEVLALLIAQSGYETSNWRDIPNYNFGGIKATGDNPYVQALVDGNPGNRHVYAFAAYPSAAEGAKAYVGLLNAHGREPWWAGLQTGDPETYVNALLSIPGAHYFEGNSANYLASIRAKVVQFANLAQQYARKLPASSAADVFYKATAPLDIIAQLTQQEAVHAPIKTIKNAINTLKWIEENKTGITIGALVVLGGVVYAVMRR